MVMMALCSESMAREHDSIPASDPWQVTAVHWNYLERRLTVMTSALRTHYRFRDGEWLLDLDVRDPALKRHLLQLWMAELTGSDGPDLGTPMAADPESARRDQELAAPPPGSASVSETGGAATDRGSESSSPTVILAGKLQTAPKEGRPDRQGKPTAWARFLGHVPERDGAVLFSTTFHGRTREIALGLRAEDPITAQGYLHWHRPSSSDDRRLSTFSVIHLLQYPGKPQGSS
jgi:hypothetical protein